MIKKQNLAALLCIGAAVSLSSCHDDIGFKEDGNGTGSIAPLVELNTAVVSSQKTSSRAGDDVTKDDLSLTIASADGSFSKTWEKLADYDPETPFKVGKYTVSAFYGDVETEGFERPAYYGSQEIEVLENEKTNVSLLATLANSMVSIDYTEAFRNYMEEFDATAQSTGGEMIYFSANETRPAYLRPGEVKVNVSFTTPGGQFATLQVAKFTAQARHHYRLKVDLNNGTGNGTAQLVIVFDDQLDKEDVRIDLNDELFNAPAPEVKGSGDLQSGKVFTHTLGDVWNTPLKANVFARGTIAELTLTTESASLKSQGWPASVDLANMDERTKAALSQLGLKVVGFDKGASTMAVLDFSDVPNHLTEADNNANNFTITVVDAMTKTNEVPFQFAVNTIPMTLSLANPQTLKVGATEFSFNVNYNGSNSSSISFELKNERGTWDKVETVSMAKTATDGVYAATVKVPADAKPVTVRAVTKVKTSDAITVNRVAPEFTVSAPENGVWATHATLVLASTDANPVDLAKVAAVSLSTDGTNFSAVNATVSENTLTVTGLTPGTAYTAHVTVTGSESEFAATTFTTEAATVVPNGDFENLTQSLSESGLNQNGKWSISAGINYQNTVKYTISEPDGWASVNKKTTSSSTRNTLFVVRSTFNTSLSYTSTVPPIKVMGTGGGTETPASYKGFTAHSGANAMVVRNVAWDPAGSVPGVWRKEFAGSNDYYNHNMPDISRISAGKLFLGSYSYSGGNESYNEGTAFASRPASLAGFYTYTCDAQDTSENGTVLVQVMNGSTVIGSGSSKLTAASAYAPFNVKINYTANAPKATAVRIMFCSSDKSSEGAIKVTTYNSRYEGYKHGATLVVDNLSFNY